MEPMKPMKPMEPMKPMRSEAWWPEALGQPASSGGQDGLRYAVFPEKRRLLIERGGEVEAYDTGGRHISGVQQASGGEPVLNGPDGPVRLGELEKAD